MKGLGGAAEALLTGQPLSSLQHLCPQFLLLPGLGLKEVAKTHRAEARSTSWWVVATGAFRGPRDDAGQPDTIFGALHVSSLSVDNSTTSTLEMEKLRFRGVKGLRAFG